MSVRGSTLRDDLHLLGRHVERASPSRRWSWSSPCRRPSCRLGGLRDAEVEHLHRIDGPSARRDEEQVRRLEIAMDDAERVRLGDRLAGLEHELDRVARPARGPLCSSHAERSPPSRNSMTMYGAPFSKRPDVDDRARRARS